MGKEGTNMLWTKPAASFQLNIQGHILVFILFSLFAENSKRIALKKITLEETSSFETIFQASVGLQLAPGWLCVARMQGHWSVPVPVEAPKAAATDTGTNSLFKALAAI